MNDIERIMKEHNPLPLSIAFVKAIEQYVTKANIKLLKKMLNSQIWTYAHSIPLEKELERLEKKFKKGLI